MWNPDARAMAADALGRVRLEVDTVMPALLNALRDSDDNVCVTAAASLGALGEEAVESLIAALSDSRVRCRREVALVLGRFGPAARKAAPAICDCSGRSS